MPTWFGGLSAHGYTNILMRKLKRLRVFTIKNTLLCSLSQIHYRYHDGVQEYDEDLPMEAIRTVRIGRTGRVRKHSVMASGRPELQGSRYFQIR